ncbi:hypothetical protein J4573_49375 [Actinomadura barringtoniae]|uniref:Uncharacterized protein n=1 Tax=Actinomadura barringtoniae TaxID=1427535 RepID=A0A939PM62_9ACTN|nr:hypothetical protein [Actinomadura barringtoniae]MBO2455175.1 hypothetical protein [Actinomadura barringtoniae]
MRVLTTVRVAPPVPLADGESGLACTASAEGVIGVLATSEPGLARGFVRGPNHNRMPFYRPPRSCPAVLYTHEAHGWHRLELACLPVSYPVIALLPRGELLVACPCIPQVGGHPEPRNAHVFGSDGTHLRTFALGDDIERIVSDDSGTIWTTHGEEGWPESFSLVRRDPHGTWLWDSGIACLDDAVNSQGGVTWAYRSRSLIRIQAGRTAEYDSPVDDVRALAFDGDHLLLAGSDDRLWWCALVDGVIRRLDAAKIVGPAGETLRDWQILDCHGPHLYFHDQGDGYHRVDITGEAHLHANGQQVGAN